MRDLLFKNLTSVQKKRKILASCEVTDKAGVRSTIRRHFIYTVREISAKALKRAKPQVYVIKEHNQKEKRERFFCKIKGYLSATNQGKLYEISYLHSLNISLINSSPFLSEA